MRTIVVICCLIALAGCPPEEPQVVEISDLAGLQAMANNLSGEYILTADIDASASSGWNAGAGFAPIGDGTTPFSGTFDGQGFTVSGLVINRPSASYVGLFGKATGTISNVILKDASVTGSVRTGALVGWLSTGGSVTNCRVSGVVSGWVATGGLVGSTLAVSNAQYGGTIDKCVSSCTVTGTGVNTGGLVGNAHNPTITDSYATSNVSGANNTGGFIGLGNVMTGYENPITVTRCYCTGNVSGTTDTNLFSGSGPVPREGLDVIENLFYNIDSVLVHEYTWPSYGMGLPLTTEQMANSANFTGFDFVNTWMMDKTPKLIGNYVYTGSTVQDYVDALEGLMSAGYTQAQAEALIGAANAPVATWTGEAGKVWPVEPVAEAWAYSLTLDGYGVLAYWQTGQWLNRRSQPDELTFTYPATAAYAANLKRPNTVTLKDQDGTTIQTFRIKSVVPNMSRQDAALMVHVEAEDLLCRLGDTYVIGYAPGQAVLAADLSASAMSMTVDDDTGYGTSGTVLIDNEKITYSGVSSGVMTITARGVGGTTAAAHLTGARVRQGKTIAAHAHDLIDDYAVGVTPQSITSDIDTDLLFVDFDGVTVIQAIRQLYTLSGNYGHFYCTGSYFYWDAPGARRTERITLGYNLRGFTRTSDESQLCTRLYMQGAGLSPSTRVALSSPGYVENNVGTYGRIDGRIVRDDIYDTDTLDALAAKLIDVISVPRVNYGVSAIDLAAAGVALRLNIDDRVHLVDTEADIEDWLSVVGITRQLHSPLDVVYEFENRAIDLAATMDAILDEIRRLQNRDYSVGLAQSQFVPKPGADIHTIGTSNAQGTSSLFAREDHQHANNINLAAPGTIGGTTPGVVNSSKVVAKDSNGDVVIEAGDIYRKDGDGNYRDMNAIGAHVSFEGKLSATLKAKDVLIQCQDPSTLAYRTVGLSVLAASLTSMGTGSPSGGSDGDVLINADGIYRRKSGTWTLIAS